ncbi:MAG: Peptidase rane alanine aminopeptidase [Thermomicrobiales bacterium]|nr:Peptidase rane alanine aminopeptidase [Thermomicrobiales bacterium]
MFHAAELDVTFGEGPGGITLIEAFPPYLPDQETLLFERVPEMIEVFTERFGPYPFASLGSTVFADTSFNAALETQGMIGYDRSAVSERTIAHEVAHQWFGNSVSPAADW